MPTMIEPMPSDYLHRQLWLMGLDAEQRHAIIRLCTLMAIQGTPAEPLALAHFVLGSSRAEQLANLKIGAGT